MRPALSIPKVVEVLGVCEETVRNLYRQGQLEGYKVGRKYLIFQDSITTFQKRNSNAVVASYPLPVEEKKERSAPRRRRQHERHYQ